MGRGKRKGTSGTRVPRAAGHWEARGFKVTKSAGLTLLAPPKAGKSISAAWPLSDRPFRSALLNEQGRVVSLGFPKFFNWGEDPLDTGILERALAEGKEVVWSEKMDGSLIIRSVVRGEVILRTRASFDGGLYGKAARAIAKKSYPELLDPAFSPDLSLLLEFVSPDFRVVLLYPKEDLFLVGAVCHETLKQLEWPELVRLGKEHGLHLVEAHSLPRDTKALFATVSEWKNREGIVARFGQTLVKLKGAEYLARHRLRFALTARAIRVICEMRDVRELKEFESYLVSQGGDWELASDARPFVEDFIVARERAGRRFNDLEAEVAVKRVEYPARKDFALSYALALPLEEKVAAFALLDNNRKHALEALENAYLDTAFTTAADVDRALAETLAEDEA